MTGTPGIGVVPVPVLNRYSPDINQLRPQDELIRRLPGVASWLIQAISAAQPEVLPGTPTLGTLEGCLIYWAPTGEKVIWVMDATRCVTWSVPIARAGTAHQAEYVILLRAWEQSR